MSDHWPSIRVKRFSGESPPDYARRRAEVIAIISGFRKSRFFGVLADRLDDRLDALLSGDFDPSRPDPHGLLASGPPERRRPRLRAVAAEPRERRSA